MDRNAFFAAVREEPFGGSLTQSQVEGLNHLLDVWEKFYNDKSADFLAYCLGTAYHETARTIQPIEEYGKGKGHPYGLPAGPFKKAYYGRGFVQLTWDYNYIKARKRLKEVFGVDYPLDEKPELAMLPDVAAHILFLGSIEGWFTGKKLADYFVASHNPISARKIINGLDKAEAIAGYYDHFAAALKAAKAQPGAVKPLPTIKPIPPATAPATKPATGSFWAALGTALSSLFRRS